VKTRMRARRRIAAALALGTTIGATTGLAAAPAAGQVDQTNPLQVSARQQVLAGRSVPVHGSLTTGQGGRTVLVQASRGHGWTTVTKARTNAQGRFQAKWRPGDARHYGLRTVLTGTAGAVRTVGGGVTVYRPAAASWYGPGLYGSHLACGGTLDSSVVGVANKSLPCGSHVRLRYRGRTVTARVVDRGPYAAGREFDLTAATKEKLRFGSTGTVWASRVR
jgi:rare lipoprotein A